LENRQLGASSSRFHDADDPLMNQLQAWSYDPYQLQVHGAVEMQSGRLMESLPFYEKAVRLNPGDGTGYDALGDVLLQLGRLDEARRVLEAGIAAAPDLSSIYSTLAQVIRKQGRPRDAVEVLRRAADRLPTSPEIRNDLGVALEEAGIVTDAAAAYREAIHLNPAFAEAHLNLGLCLEELGSLEEANEHFRIALELRPGNPDTLLALAKADLSAERWHAASRRLELLLGVAPNRPDALNLLAIAHLRLGLQAGKAGRTADAEREFLAGLAADPNVPELQANQGVLVTQRGEITEAIGYFQRFATLAPDDPIAYLYLGQALMVAHRTDEARNVLLQGITVAQRAGKQSETERLQAALDLIEKPQPP
jgi:Flp pilus assembly protein TadD